MGETYGALQRRDDNLQRRDDNLQRRHSFASTVEMSVDMHMEVLAADYDDEVVFVHRAYILHPTSYFLPASYLLATCILPVSCFLPASYLHPTSYFLPTSYLCSTPYFLLSTYFLRTAYSLLPTYFLPLSYVLHPSSYFLPTSYLLPTVYIVLPTYILPPTYILDSTTDTTDPSSGRGSARVRGENQADVCEGTCNSRTVYNKHVISILYVYNMPFHINVISLGTTASAKSTPPQHYSFHSITASF
jgi:hypothetical protein